MYGVKAWINPEEIFNRLSEEDQKRFEKCAFDEVTINEDGCIEISCLLYEKRKDRIIV